MHYEPLSNNNRNIMVIKNLSYSIIFAILCRIKMHCNIALMSQLSTLFSEVVRDVGIESYVLQAVVFHHSYTYRRAKNVY